MESQVWVDFSIEEIIEKLHKDCQEEMAVILENRRKLDGVGSRLAMVRGEGVASETQPHMEGTCQHWQCLLDFNGARVKRLRITLTAVEQLAKKMSGLQSWLTHIETKLTDPITYHTCDLHEIQRRLSQQQGIQRDIEEHSADIESVLSLCEALLQDCDADDQFDTIQQASRTLEQQWRNVQASSTQRINQIKETESLRERFMEDFSCYEDWLMASEKMAALPSSSGLLYTAAKQELKKLEALEKQVQDNVTLLDSIIRQYQHLHREDCTGSSCQLQDIVHQGKQRWEALNDMVAFGQHRLKEFIGARAAFESVRDAVLIWATTLDLQLTNIEHFSECDPQDKLILFQVLQDEISLNADKIEDAIHQGELLSLRSDPLDAAVIEEECAELHRFCEDVFGRVHRYQEKLIGLQGEDLGRGSPASMDSIPLEWDHEYDLSHAATIRTGDVGSLDNHVQQSLKDLHTSHLCITDCSDFVRSTSSASVTTDLIGHREHTPKQVSSEEICMKYDMNQGEDLNSHDLQRSCEGHGLAESELNQLLGWDLRTNPQTTQLLIGRVKPLSELVWTERLHLCTQLQCKSSPTQPELAVNSLQLRTGISVSSDPSCSECHWRAFLRCVLWTALPLQLFFLVLLGLACLVPPTQEDHSYALAKILVQNLHPALCFTHGPPPV